MMDFQGFFDGLLNASWLQVLVEMIFSVIMLIVNILLLPFSAAINALFPDFDNALQQVGDMLNVALTYIGWAFEAFAVPSLLIGMVVAYYTFTVTAKLTVWAAKVGLNWYKALR